MIQQKKFLTAEWRKLIMANYCVNPEILSPYLPAGTELDSWNGKHYISLVGFMFVKTKLLGLSIPFHTDFPEVNLRFYVRYRENGNWKRGVVFINEFVPKPALAFVANTIFKERYVTMPMKTYIGEKDQQLHVKYEWKKEKWNRLEVRAAKQLQPIEAGSEAEFITEHYWGYTSMTKGKMGEYNVSHPQWQIYPVTAYNIICDFARVYGNHFSSLNELRPASVFLAEGSTVAVYPKKILKAF